MSINRVHRKRNNFSMILNEPIQDTALSWAARGLLCYLLTKPDGWEVKTSHLIEMSDNEQEKRLLSVLRELEERGYVIRWSERGDRGRIEWYSEVFECLDDAEEWLKENSKRINNSFRLSKGTSAMHGQRKTAERKTKTSRRSKKTLSMSPAREGGESMDGASMSGDAEPSEMGVLLNTDLLNTESVSTELNKIPPISPKGDDRGLAKENPIALENPDPIATEQAKPEHPTSSTLALTQKEDVPPPELGSLSIIKTAADVKPAVTRAKAKKMAELADRRAKYNPDGAAAWWDMFRTQAHKNNCKPGNKSEALDMWDLLHEIEPDEGKATLCDRIIQGTEYYWEREGMRQIPNCKNGVRYLKNRDYQDALDWADIRSTSNSQPAQKFAPFLTCFNQDKPTRWPGADKSDLGPKSTGRLEELIASCDNSLERFQKALLYCKRDGYWSLERSLTFEEFLYCGKINDFYRKQINDEALGLDKTIAPTKKDIEAAASRQQSKMSSVRMFTEDYRRGDYTLEEFRKILTDMGVNPESVPDAR